MRSYAKHKIRIVQTGLSMYFISVACRSYVVVGVIKDTRYSNQQPQIVNVFMLFMFVKGIDYTMI